jgi:hypothetical protein
MCLNLADWYDIALMSTKGLSVTAARQPIDEMTTESPLLGFSILGTLQRDTRRYTFMNKIEVIDLGLRLKDIEGLQAEPSFDQESRRTRTSNRQMNGATEAEVNFLLDARVELNAMTSDRTQTNPVTC